jgi:PKD domain.
VDSFIAPRTFHFKGFSIHAQNDEVLGYWWTFGDGTTAVGRNVTHSYQQAGRYEVCMFIKTRKGCETKVCQTVRFPGTNQPAITFTPNPVNDFLRIGFTSTQTEQVNITILSITEAQVRSFVKDAVEGTNIWDFDLSNLIPGMYTVGVQSSAQLASAVFIKL